MAAAAAGKRMIKLKSCDGKVFEVEEAVAMELQTIKHMIEDDCANSIIPIANVTGSTLYKLIENFKKHVETPAEDDLKAWDAEFIDVDQSDLYDLIVAANFLNIKDCYICAARLRQT